MMAASRSPRRLRRAQHDPPRVLVADDDPDLLAVLVDILSNDGYEVQAESDGGRLLVQLAKGTTCNYRDVDLVISDIRMPICSGMQIVETLRAAHCNVPIILMTGIGDASVKRRAEMLDAVLFMKPFSMHDLRDAVQSLLRSPPSIC